MFNNGFALFIKREQRRAQHNRSTTSRCIRFAQNRLIFNYFFFLVFFFGFALQLKIQSLHLHRLQDYFQHRRQIHQMPLADFAHLLFVSWAFR